MMHQVNFEKHSRRAKNTAQDDEGVIKTFLRDKSMITSGFEKSEIRKKKTPDFKVFDSLGRLAFYCEVKSISKDDWLERQLEDAPPLTIVGGARYDPAYNKVSNKIHEAVAQFDSVNPDLTVPNVLMFVNHEDMCDKMDLVFVLTGNFCASSGTKHPIYHRYSEGRIAKEKARIHLFIWFEDKKPTHIQFNCEEMPAKYLCSCLKIDFNGIRWM